MKYIKTYENYYDVDSLLNSTCLYFDEVTPISKEEGFLNCLYDDPNFENNLQLKNFI